MTNTARAQRIAAIHAFADWLAQHPEVPMPDDIAAYSHAGSAADVHDFADTKQLQVSRAKSDQASTTRWATIPISTTDDHGVNIRYVRIGH